MAGRRVPGRRDGAFRAIDTASRDGKQSNVNAALGSSSRQLRGAQDVILD
jgi:hypothetical protein